MASARPRSHSFEVAFSLFTEEKTFPTMQDAIDYLKALDAAPLGVVLHIRVHGRNIPFGRDNVSKLMREL